MEYKYISVFDLDHTLLRVNSSFRFGLYLFLRGKMSITNLISWFTFYFRYKYFDISLDNLHQAVFKKLFYGRSIEEYNPLVEAFVAKHIDKMIKVPIVEKLEKAQRAGHYTVILSNSPIFVVEPIAKYLKVDEYDATRYLIDEEGVLKAVDKTIDGADKAEYVIDLAKRMGVPLDNVTAYTDSHVDEPMLAVAGNPIVVDPTPRLQDIAQKRGWQIIKT